MTAAWFWARSELRARWRSWIVLGALAGATVGLAAAGVAGARRTADALPRYLARSQLPTAGVLANDPGFDAAQRAAVAALPEVRASQPFLVAIGLDVKPEALQETRLLPTEPASVAPMVGVLVAGRLPDPKRADEVVVDQNARARYGLRLGATMSVAQTATPAELASLPPGIVVPGAVLNFHQDLRVVGISKSVSSDASWTASSGLYAKYKPGGFVNQFVTLRGGDADFTRFQRDVERIAGHPIDVESFRNLAGLVKVASVNHTEEQGLLLFALAVIIGGWVLVGQALSRAVVAGAADLDTWRAIGADRRIVTRALVLPAFVTVVTGVVIGFAVAVGLSSRFPIGLARRYDLDPGTHIDWAVLAVAALVVFVAVLATAMLSALYAVTRRHSTKPSASMAGSWATRLGLPPALAIGSRLAVEPGRGRRAVPVRSALIGAIVGILGLVGALTFRAGISDAVASPQRSGIVWNYEVAAGEGLIPPKVLASVVRNRDVAAAIDAVWARALRINGVSTPTFGVATVKGGMQLVVLRGRAPQTPTEIAFAPSTFRALKVHLGQRVPIGAGNATALVVGEALLPATSHTDYDQSAWMTAAGLRATLPPANTLGPDFLQDILLVKWSPGVDPTAAARRLGPLTGNDSLEESPAVLPTAVIDLGRLRSLPLALAVFFALLGCATVAHALVTTVRRRRADLAVLRSLGFTRRQTRLAIAWQATLIAVVGLLVGVPLGIVAGRLVWRELADTFPVVYVPPVAFVAVLVVVPAAIVLANLLAAGPARAAARIRPAEALRTE